MTEEERDSGLRRLQLASLAVCGILLVMVVFTLLFTVASKNSANAVKDGNDAATCRSQFSGVITDTRTNLDNARASVNVAQFDGLVAATVNRDDVRLEAAVKRGQAASRSIAKYQRQAAKANAAYQELLRAEVSDRVRFERMCGRGP